jgi:hypothetical protein
MNALSARALLGKIAIENQIHLASIEMLPTTSLRLAINDAGTSWWSSQPQRSRVHRRYARVNADYAMKETPAKWRTPVSRARRSN